MLSGMCLDETQSRQGSLGAPDATRCRPCVQETQDPLEAKSRIIESGHNTTVFDAGHRFPDDDHFCTDNNLKFGEKVYGSERLDSN